MFLNSLITLGTIGPMPKLQKCRQLTETTSKVCNFRISGPRIVTVNNEKPKVRPKIVTPSKVSINAQGCTSSNNTLIPKTGVSNNGVSPGAQQKGFLSNKFDILVNLQDSSLDPYTEEGMVDDEVQPCKALDVLSHTDNAQIPFTSKQQHNNHATQVINNTAEKFLNLPQNEHEAGKIVEFMVLRKNLEMSYMLCKQFLYLPALIRTRPVDMSRNKLLLSLCQIRKKSFICMEKQTI